MKRFITTLFLFFFAQISCYAVEDCQTDSIESGFRVFGNDTLVTINYENFISRGLAQYIDDSPVYYGHIDYDVIHCEGNYYIHRNMSNFIQDIIEGYGKERCREMFKLFSKSNKSLKLLVRIRVNIEGVITCVEFLYSSELNPFMTYEDIKRNTKIMINRKADPYLAEYGIELSPWMTFPIPVTALQKHLYQVTDHKYNGKTIRFDYRQNSMVCGYVKEQCNDSIVFNSNESSKNKYLKDKDVLAAIDSVQRIALEYLNRVNFEENKNVVISLNLNEVGEVVETKLYFPLVYKKDIWAKPIFIITKKIKENIKFTPPGKYGCNAISIDVPVNKLQDN